jgi:hypothetical protein
MADKEKSFEDLVKEAPTGGTVSLVGTLAQSSEAGKFVLNLQDGRAMTLETASVKGHTVLGTSLGQTIVRIDVDPGSLPADAFDASRLRQPVPSPWLRFYEPVPLPWLRFYEAMQPSAVPEGVPFSIPYIDVHTGILDRPKPPPFDNTFPGHPYTDV